MLFYDYYIDKKVDKLRNLVSGLRFNYIEKNMLMFNVHIAQAEIGFEAISDFKRTRDSGILLYLYHKFKLIIPLKKP
jgi:hypothetical protein